MAGVDATTTNVTVLSPRLVTISSLPSGVTATPRGSRPTGRDATFASDAVSTTEIASRVDVAKSLRPSGETANA